MEELFNLSREEQISNIINILKKMFNTDILQFEYKIIKDIDFIKIKIEFNNNLIGIFKFTVTNKNTILFLYKYKWIHIKHLPNIIISSLLE